MQSKIFIEKSNFVLFLDGIKVEGLLISRRGEVWIKERDQEDGGRGKNMKLPLTEAEADMRRLNYECCYI
jgi:hypothetical protein